MTVQYTKNEYGSSKGILIFPDHYVAMPIKHAKAASGSAGIATLVDGRYIVKAGTIYPANDSSAIGVVLSDVDCTDGDEMMAVIIHGFIAQAKMPVAPAAAAITALNEIKFLPIKPFYTVALTSTLVELATGLSQVDTVVIGIENGEFKAAAGLLTNWTITGESVNKAVWTAPVVSDDFKTVSFTVTTTVSEAGSNTIRPAAIAVSVNAQPAAFTALTVA